MISLLSVLPAVAHEFTLFYLLPPDISDTDEADMRAAFLIASHERDNHPNETSDGHLGGVDVHLTLIPFEPGMTLIALQPDLVALPLDWPGAEEARARFATAPAAWPPKGDLAAEWLAEPGDPALPAFADAFRSATGADPSAAAQASYVMARMIDAVVRPLDGPEPAADLQAALDAMSGR